MTAATRRFVNSTQLSAALALIAVALVVAGVALLAGVAWALITTGVFALAGAFLLYEPRTKT